MKYTLIKPGLALDAAKHLTNWLEMDICECEGRHSCGYYEVERTRDDLLTVAEQQPAPGVAGLVEALEELSTAWRALQSENDGVYQDAIAALSAYRERQRG